MSERDHRDIQGLLKKALPPMDVELHKDLWPAMHRKLARMPVVPWYDWALLGASAGALVLFPSLVLLFAYHF